VHLLILGGTRAQRMDAARAAAGIDVPHAVLDPATLPFIRPRDTALPAAPCVILIHDIDRAFVDRQRPGTRLVLTQSTYLLQAWLDALSDGARLIVTADRVALDASAPEATQSRGPWSVFQVVSLDGAFSETTTKSTNDTQDQEDVDPLFMLARAYSQPDVAERLRLCRAATTTAPESAAAWLALASACREATNVPSARAALDRAGVLAPDWAAVPYERGKLWLAYDDLEHARDEFQRAVNLMPTFSAAFSNLGATLGELDDTEGALAAFERALAHDANSVTVLNNVGVVSRELGRLAESEAALARVTALAPDFVFGHYNLGHTRFLAGRFREALAAYEEGWRRDREKNARQGCRLAVTRFATGDAAGADRDLWRSANAAPPDEREDLLLEACDITRALIAAHPPLAVHRAFLDRLEAEILKSE
jgi:tetratricopeptide (TPR) repeat protein